MTPKQALREHVKEHGCDCPDGPGCMNVEHYDDRSLHVTPAPGVCEVAQHLRAVVAES